MARIEATIDSADNTGGDETVDVTLNDWMRVFMFRYINNWDVSADITVEVTDGNDTDFSESEDIRGGTAGPAALAVSGGSVDSDYLTEPWTKARITISPASSPSGGSFELRTLRK